MNSYRSDWGVLHICKGPSPSSDSWLGLAPCSRSSSVHSVLLFVHASWSAAFPPALRLGCAPCSSRYSRQAVKPCAAAMHSGLVSSRLYSKDQRPTKGCNYFLSVHVSQLCKILNLDFGAILLHDINVSKEQDWVNLITIAALPSFAWLSEHALHLDLCLIHDTWVMQQCMKYNMGRNNHIIMMKEVNFIGAWECASIEC